MSDKREDIDAIVGWLLDRLHRELGVNLASDRFVVQRLRDSATQAWTELHSAPQCKISLPFITADDNGPKHLETWLSRSELAGLRAPVSSSARESQFPVRSRPSGVATKSTTGKLTLQVGDQYQRSTGKVDLCFVFDTTGSMSDKIDGLVACMVDFVRELATLSLDWRITVVPFGDLTVPGDRVVGDLPFVSERDTAERLLRTMPHFSGGGNLGESVIEALNAALIKPYRTGAVKIFVLLTDEPALVTSQSPDAVQLALKQSETIVFSVAPDLRYYRDWAQSTGGMWFPVGSAVDTSAMVTLLRSLALRVATVAADVHRLGAGSVRRYLELNRGS